MPMQGTPLAPLEIAALKKWIEEGAIWDANIVMTPVDSGAASAALQNRPLTRERGSWAFALPVQAPAPVVDLDTLPGVVLRG